MNIARKLFCLFFFFLLCQSVFATHYDDPGTRGVIEKYELSSANLETLMTREQFLIILSRWYPDYAARKNRSIPSQTTLQLDNSQWFQDVDLESEFGQTLLYYVELGAFKKAEKFNSQNILSLRDFFTVMSRLNVMFSLENCKNLQICEWSTYLDDDFPRGDYLRYVSKILDPGLRIQSVSYNTSASQKNFVGYVPENGSREIIKKYGLSSANLETLITRKQFLIILSRWYPDYVARKNRNIPDKATLQLDNSQWFKDVDLSSDFGQTLLYYVELGAFKKAEYFNPQNVLSFRDFFTVMSRLNVMYTLESCKSLLICDRNIQLDDDFPRGIYLRYVSKILDPSLRTRPVNPQDYLDLGYQPYLHPGYRFPLHIQSLNACYFFTVKHILKYKYGVNINVQQLEKDIGKDTTKISYVADINKFNAAVGVTERKFWDIEVLFTNLQKGEPLALSYMIEITNRQGEKVQIPHVVAGYSFDENGIWVSESVSGKRKNIPYESFFNEYGKSRLNAIRQFTLD